MNEYNAKEIFGNARMLCPGLPEEIYWLCDYISILASPDCDEDFHCLILSGIEGLMAGYCKLPYGVPFPEKLFINKERVIKKSRYIQQLIDVATDDEFAADLRESCGYEYTWYPTMKRIGISPELDSAIKAAAEWWIGTIWLDRADYDESLEKDLSDETEKSIEIRSNLSKSDIVKFRQCLVTQIADKISKMGSAVLSAERIKKKRGEPIFTHTHMTRGLDEAFREIGINNLSYHCFLPNKILMYVTPDVVKVLVDDATEFATIWRKN